MLKEAIVITNDATITIGTFILIIGFVFSAYNFWVSRKKDAQDDATQFIKVNMKLDEICRTTSDIKADFRSISKQIDELKEAKIINEQQLKALWKQVDKLNKKE